MTRKTEDIHLLELTNDWILFRIGNRSNGSGLAPEPASRYRKTRRVIERFGDESDWPTTQSSPGANSEKEQKFAWYRIACRVDKSVLSWQVFSLLCELPRHFRDFAIADGKRYSMKRKNRELLFLILRGTTSEMGHKVFGSFFSTS